MSMARFCLTILDVDGTFLFDVSDVDGTFLFEFSNVDGTFLFEVSDVEGMFLVGGLRSRWHVFDDTQMNQCCW